MPIWKTAKGWRYQFQLKGRRFSRAWFKTKKEAMDAMAAHRRGLQTTPISPVTPIAMAFSTLSNEYLDYARRRFTTKTYKYKAWVFRSFIDFAGDLPLDQITIQILESYLRTRPTNTNYNRHRKDLCALLMWAWRRRYIQDNPCHWLEKMPEPGYRRTLPSPEDINRVLLAAGPDRPFLLTLYFTMGRVDEILRLKWQDVHFSRREITLWTRKRKDGSWQSDNIPMHPELYGILKDLWEKRQNEEWVFLNSKTGTRYQNRPKLMRGLCRQAGVKPFGFHALRHFVASYLDDVEKVSMKKLQELLRHRSQRTTERYLQSVDQASHEVLGKLPSPHDLPNLLTAPAHKIEVVAEATTQLNEIIGGDEGI